MVAFALLPVLALASAQDLVAERPPPLPIVGGTDAAPCEWPATVMMLEDDETPVMCSGSLIAPDVVLTAAHCLIPERPIVAIGFGEAGQVFGVPAFTVAPTECVQHPDYAQIGTSDIAYCRLAEPVTTVPITPLLAGCEIDALQPGQSVTIVGFGATWGSYDEENDAVISMGVGAKRHTTQTIEWVDLNAVEVNMVGPNGSQSACFGDSGGPALIELSDGSWRVFGAGSHLYDPGNLPPPMEPDNICGAGVAYSYAPATIEWLESATGVDLTPCWDGDAFVEGEACGDFPLAPGTAAGTWKNGCAGGAQGGGELTCEPAASETGGDESTGGEESTGGGTDPTTTGTTASDDTTGAADDTTGGASDATATGSPTTTAATTTTGDATATGTALDDSGGSEGTSGDEDDDDGGGCGCVAAPSQRRWTTFAWALLLPLVARRRNRR